jgi:hypothetical protein
VIASLDHAIRALPQRRRDRDPERFDRLEVDHEVDARRLFE